MNFEQLKTQIDELIRSGQRDQAGLMLQELKGKSVPRNHLSSMANLARRAGQLNLAFQMMAPVIRPKVPLDNPATDEEKASYAIILLGLGATSEALELLENSDSKNADINLALGFTFINRWDYLSAIPKLKSYLRSAEVPAYQQMIAKVNLAASYVATGQTEEGHELLQEILSATKENGWQLLYKNGLEISSQIAIQQKRWDEAVQFLNHAIVDGQKQFNLDDFFIAKWQAIICLLRDGPSSQALLELEKVRSSAIENKHWETIRDCDFYRAVTVRDPKLALDLYFGTPYASYRQRLMERARDWFSAPNEYHWQINKQPSQRIFHLSMGNEVGGKASLKTGTVLHLALTALVSDFYRPFSVGSLHTMVFPKEHFNPFSSPRRVAFVIQRLRKWFLENEIPLLIVTEKDGFRLQATDSFTFVIDKVEANAKAKSSQQSDDPSSFLNLHQKLKSQGSADPMSAKEISEISGVSIRTVRYFIKWAIGKNKVKKIGSGRETRYKIR